MADQLPEGVTVDRSGDRPVRTDNRSVMQQLHDELAAHFAGKEPKHAVDGQAKTVDQVVDEAVKGAPAPGDGEY